MPKDKKDSEGVTFDDIALGKYSRSVRGILDTVDEDGTFLGVQNKVPGIGAVEGLITGDKDDDDNFLQKGLSGFLGLVSKDGEESLANRDRVKSLEAFEFKEGIQNVDLKGALSDTEGRKLTALISALPSGVKTEENLAIDNLKRMDGFLSYVKSRKIATDGGRLTIKNGVDYIKDPKTNKFVPGVVYLNKDGILVAERVAKGTKIPKFYSVDISPQQLQTGIKDLKEGAYYLYDGQLKRK